MIDFSTSEEDIKNKILRTPIKSDKTFHNDKIRTLRALRFIIKYKLRVDDELKIFLQENLYLFQEAAAERIYAEYIKLVKEPQSLSDIKILDKYKFFEILFPEISATKNVLKISIINLMFGITLYLHYFIILD